MLDWFDQKLHPFDLSSATLPGTANFLPYVLAILGDDRPSLPRRFNHDRSFCYAGYNSVFGKVSRSGVVPDMNSVIHPPSANI